MHVTINQLIVDRHMQIGNLRVAFISDVKSVLWVSILIRIFFHTSHKLRVIPRVHWEFIIQSNCVMYAF